MIILRANVVWDVIPLTKRLNTGAERKISKMLTNKELKDKVVWEYNCYLRKWNNIQSNFDFQRQYIHNIHLTKTLREMLIILDRLQMLSYLLEKWDD